jgi:hypothetical protein
MTGGWFDDEAIEQERRDADLEMYAIQAEGDRIWQSYQLAQLARRRGDFDIAYRICFHGGGYPLDSLAAERANDPAPADAYPEHAFRCLDCGAILDLQHPRTPWHEAEPLPVPEEHRLRLPSDANEMNDPAARRMTDRLINLGKE